MQSGQQLRLQWLTKRHCYLFFFQDLLTITLHTTCSLACQCQIYYPQITPIVVQACMEFGVRYNCKDRLFEALGVHASYLKMLRQEKEKPVCHQT